uniref:NADH:ubiquinone reductase (H(+)-translocating) n=1 Tax=Caulobothrium sp. MZUSP 7990 TaxID=2899621 RepID=A0A8K1W4B0_9CEST|nr:NADH dehydrogenase subunit 5 [Caulobothrium sp. MZUSP 7990]
MLFLLLSFILLSICCFSLLALSAGYSLNVLSISLNGMYWLPLLQLDNVTFSILLMLGICFGYAYFYTGHYFSGDIAGVELNKIIMLFVIVMASLVLTGDYLTTLIFWEYLGVVSFFLILFYANYLSLRASVVTLVSSRFGDVCLFLLIGLCVFNGYNLVAGGLLFFFIIITKSAGFPFISWLLEAMRAPTPVSSLVHSSTLVAAGVWFSMRYDMFTFFNDSIIFSFCLLLTIFITGVCCFYFLDLKKIVALSTCNNISWCVFYLLFGDVTLSLFQLVSHGVSKCLLFMLVGDVMSGSSGSQASNCVYSSQLYGNLGLFGLFSVILGLSGAPFVGVFFTKHILLSSVNSSINLTLCCFLYLCVFLSYFYSFRLCRVLMNINVSLSSGVLYTFSSGLMVYLWLFINYFTAGSLDEVSGVSHFNSALLISFQLISCLTAYYFYNSIILGTWSSSLFGCDNLVEASYNIYLQFSQSASLFFYRWDNQSLSIFNGRGVQFVTIFNTNLLNITLISILFFFMCWFIVY